MKINEQLKCLHQNLNSINSGDVETYEHYMNENATDKKKL